MDSGTVAWIQATVVGVVLGGFALPALGGITDDLVVNTSSQSGPLTPGQSITTFGTTHFGGMNNTGGFDEASTAWFPGSFGMFVRGSANTTGAAQGGSGYAYGLTQESILIPSQQGIAHGEMGVLQLNYHLAGVVTIDVGDVFSGEFLISFGVADYYWSFQKKEIGTDANFVTLPGVEAHWRDNHVTEIVDRDVSVSIPFHYGMPFYFMSSFILSATAGSPTPPSVGFAEANFSEGGTFTGGIVFDGGGNALSDPIVESDTGFDYVTVPEPDIAWLSAASMIALLVTRCRRARSPAASPLS
jgi:hypothetical protein